MYPYTYANVQSELALLQHRNNDLGSPGSIYYKREVLIKTPDGRNVDLLTVSSVDGASVGSEPLIAGLFPDTDCFQQSRPVDFPHKQVVIISMI